MYGTFLAEARRARGLTQSQLAASSGIRQANISAIEHGRRVPSATTLHHLLHACGFELTATAGSHVVACPPPIGEDIFDSLLVTHPADEAPVVGRDTPMPIRVQVLTAVLDASEAIVRSR